MVTEEKNFYGMFGQNCDDLAEELDQVEFAVLFEELKRQVIASNDEKDSLKSNKR